MKTSSQNAEESTLVVESSPNTDTDSGRAPGHWPDGEKKDEGFDRLRQGAPRADDMDQYRGQSGYGGLAASNPKTEHEASEHRTSSSGQSGSFGEGNYGGELGQSARGGVSSYGNSSGSRYSIDNEHGTSSRTAGAKDSFGSAQGAAPVSTKVGQYAGEYDGHGNHKPIALKDSGDAVSPSSDASEQAAPQSSAEDDRLRQEIGARLTDHPHLEVRDVSVSVANRVVRLEGSVPERRMKHAIEDLADNVDGVLDIDNRLKVRRLDQAVAPLASADSAGQAYANAGEGSQNTGPATFGAASAKAAAEKNDKTGEQ